MKNIFLIAAILLCLAVTPKKYVVKWVVSKTLVVGCPNDGKKDNFGREIPNECTRIHFKLQHDTLSRAYCTIDSARWMYNRVNPLKYVVQADTTLGVITYVKLDSINISQAEILRLIQEIKQHDNTD